ncbi:MAG: glutamate-1-semialdehyde 2,1-aminomutase [Desulfovibrio sp.]
MNYSERLRWVIPGGAHTYSRGDDQYPVNAPQILAKGKGAYVYDPEGRKYLDYGMALRAVTLGYANPEVNAAAWVEAENGNNLTRPSLVELEAAELFTNMVPCADMVKFAKNGSSVTTGAVKLARAYNQRRHVALCGDHPFFSYDNWFIGTTVMDRGIPAEDCALSLTFKYNDAASLEALFAAHPGDISCVILEPMNLEAPRDGFLEKVRDLCDRHGAVLIFDEMITGFRWHLEGAQTYYGVRPDLATFGKAMANGFSVAALCGRRDIMDLGGISAPGAERVFLMSTTHGAEMCGLGAFVKSVEIYRRENVVEYLWDYGRRLKDGLTDVARECGLGECFKVYGAECSPNYMTLDANGETSLPLRTLFSQEMIRNGVLMPWIALSLAHGDRELDLTLEAARKALTVYAKALSDGVENFLEGRPIKPVFRKHN